MMGSLTPLSNNRIAVCGDDDNDTRMVKCYDVRNGIETDCAELKSDACGIAEVVLAGRLLLAMSCPYVYKMYFLALLSFLTENHRIYRLLSCMFFLFSEINNPLNSEKQKIYPGFFYRHSLAPHTPWRLYACDPTSLLYVDLSKEQRALRWLIYSEGRPKFIKEKSFTSSGCMFFDMTTVRFGADELVIIADRINGIQCYNTNTKNLKWSAAGELPGMQKALDAHSVTTDERGCLFVCDDHAGNQCVQMFSVSDGQYLGCLMKEGKQRLECPVSICWLSATHSLAVLHSRETIFSTGWFFKYDKFEILIQFILISPLLV